MTDIIVGSNRRYQPRRGPRSLAIALILAAVGGVAGYVLFGRLVTYAQPHPRAPAEGLDLREDGAGTALAVGANTVAHAGGLTVLRLEGTPAALGAAHGRLLEAEVGAPSAALVPAVAAAVGGDGVLDRLIRGPRLRWHYRHVDEGIPGHQLVELASLAAVGRGGDEEEPDLDPASARVGATPPLDYEVLVRTQAGFDLGLPAPGTAVTGGRSLTRSLSFVAAVRDAAGDRVLVGHSLALPGVGDGGDAAAAHPTVSFVRPEGVIGFASVGWPGLVGVFTGVNAEGIAVLVHPARTADVTHTAPGQPVPLLARDVLENARSLADAIAVLEAAAPLGAASFLVVDGPARSWAVVERSPSKSAVRRGDGPMVVTGLLEAEAFADDVENDRARRSRASAQRAQRARALVRGLTGPEQALVLLRDGRDGSGAPVPLGYRGALRDPAAVQTVLIDASTMVLWVADGPDAGGRFRAFDLRHELGAAAPAPPPDLPALSGDDPAAPARVRAARSHLRVARRALRAGRGERAREETLRALALAPTLPEALLLAGDVARAGGDHEGARRFYARCQELGIDDPDAAEEVKAVLGPGL
ncbi:C45 family autoproteolytic acyltransferase/hydolase [Haliangium sp.]|uniref:C45 family autoproteolytic acyltransferase/hydolase n=1 Tax=Haliangium sp. TaxID=2663208 RepID=UPI003D1279EE